MNGPIKSNPNTLRILQIVALCKMTVYPGPTEWEIYELHASRSSIQHICEQPGDVSLLRSSVCKELSNTNGFIYLQMDNPYTIKPSISAQYIIIFFKYL